MDDLQIMQELFTERPPPSADVIAAARARLPLNRPRRRRAVLRIGLPVSAAAATAAVIAVSGPAISGSAAEPGVYQLPAGAQARAGTTAAGRGILLTAARTVGRAAPSATGRFWVARTEIGNFLRAGPADNHYVILEKASDQNWAARSSKVGSPDLTRALGVQFASAADQAAWRRDGSPTTWNIGQYTSLADPHGSANAFDRDIKVGPGKLTGISLSYGGRQFAFGGTYLSAAQLRRLPADPARLKALLLTGFDVSQDGSAEAHLFEVTPPLLTFPVTPAVRSALYQMLASLPGVRSLGQVQDAAGQRGVGVALDASYSGCGEELRTGAGVNGAPPTFASCVVQQRLVINPHTGLPLAQELRYLKLPAGHKWTAPDGLFSFQLFQTAHWTNQSPPIYQ